MEKEAAPVRPPRDCCVAVAGLCASAGGLDAFKRFFSAMPKDSNIAFVLLPHLDPSHESLMVELIGRHTPMPVVEAAEGMPVQGNHVFVLPPNKYMTIAKGLLHLTGPMDRRATSFDVFLRSLAEDQQERAICIILSGTGAHGSLGLKAVKASGGMAMVQDPASAEYEQMPRAALASNLTDFVLPPEKMAAALAQYVQHVFVKNGRSQREDEARPEVPDELHRLLALLRAKTKHDFTCYRKKMLLRRVERRMGLNQIEHLAEYVSYLRDRPEEIKLLSRDLLISVTSFFRDPEAFYALQTQVVVPLVQACEPDTPIRVWVSGSATGEEPYSVGMLFLEQLADVRKNSRLQVFATDVDEQALETGRLGIYPETISADVSPERLTRYFSKTEDQGYQVNKPLREAVVFAVQNLIADAPFSKLDLICCRNLLIYLEPAIQQKVISLLHFALNEGGYLFLGPSETIGSYTDLFEPVNKKWRIYRRIGPVRPERVDFPIIARQPEKGKDRKSRGAFPARPVNFGEVMRNSLIEKYAPPAVLIDRKNTILYFVGLTARYLRQPVGEPTRDLLQMLREGLQDQGALGAGTGNP